MFKRIVITVIALVIFVGVIFGLKAYQNKENAAAQAALQPLPTLVDHVVSTTQTWHPYVESVGTLYALNGTDIKAQIEGRIETLNFTSGDMVQAGQVLATLDAKPLLAQIAQAKANLALAQVQLKRQQALLPSGATTRDALDTAQATAAGDQAALDQLDAQLAYKTIRAPFAGKLGLKMVSVGQYLAVGDVVANIQSLDPMHVSYPMPDQYVSQMKVGLPITLTTDTYANHTFNGTVIALHSQFDANTKSLEVEASIPNHDKSFLLYPGAFVIVHTLLPTQENVVTVSQTAVVHALYADSVYLIQPTQKKDRAGNAVYTLKQQYITVGTMLNGQVQVLKGLSGGVEVVNNGQFTLHDGSEVRLVTGS